MRTSSNSKKLQIIFYTIVVSTAFLFSPTTSASINPALYPWYDDCITGGGLLANAAAGLVSPGAAPAADASASEKAQYSYLFLAANLSTTMVGADQKLLAIAAAGIVGNLMAENGSFDVSLCNPSNHCGIAQWSTGRFSNMVAQGYDPNTLDGQLGFIIYEIGHGQKGKCGNTLDLLMAATTPEQAATAFNCSFEISGDNSGTREKNARKVYDQYAGTPIPTSGVITATLPAATENIDGEYCEYITGSSTSPVSLGGATAPTANSSYDGGCSGKAAMLCEAAKYDPVPYIYGAGHDGYKAFLARCPTPINSTACAVDCSSLISIAASVAFSQNYNWTSGSFAGSNVWREIPISQATAGDVLWRSGHVGIFQSRDSTTGSITVFQAANPDLGVGFMNSNNWAKAYTYTGPLPGGTI